jgi:hypothetical protein
MVNNRIQDVDSFLFLDLVSPKIFAIKVAPYNCF